jgi:hypothetical protein
MEKKNPMCVAILKFNALWHNLARVHAKLPGTHNKEEEIK